MKPASWKYIGVINQEKSYLGLLSYLPLKTYRAIPSVSKYASLVDSQLKKTKGVIVYSFQAELFKKQFWTLSVWEDRDCLNEFVNTLPHSEIMELLGPYMKKTNFFFWDIPGKDVPPSWDNVKKRFNVS